MRATKYPVRVKVRRFIFPVVAAATLWASGLLAQTTFTPQAFEREYTMRLDGPADEVFSLMGPEQRMKAMNGDVLVGPSGDGKAGMAFWAAHGDRNLYWVVAADDPAARTIRYVYLEGDYELMIEEIEVKPHGHGSEATIRWKVWGLTADAGVEAFLTDGRYEKMMARMQESINNRLKRTDGHVKRLLNTG